MTTQVDLQNSQRIDALHRLFGQLRYARLPVPLMYDGGSPGSVDEAGMQRAAQVINGLAGELWQDQVIKRINVRAGIGGGSVGGVVMVGAGHGIQAPVVVLHEGGHRTAHAIAFSDVGLTPFREVAKKIRSEKALWPAFAAAFSEATYGVPGSHLNDGLGSELFASGHTTLLMWPNQLGQRLGALPSKSRQLGFQLVEVFAAAYPSVPLLTKLNFRLP